MVFTIPMALKMLMMVMAFSNACTLIVQNANKSDCVHAVVAVVFVAVAVVHAVA